MATRTLHFRGVADWAIREAQFKIVGRTKALAIVHYSNKECIAGTLKIQAETREEADKAVQIIKKDRTLENILTSNLTCRRFN